MQDIHSIGAGPLFVGDRRLRPHNNNQPLKCPRCDSLNTKFCYYNNYNLSQPRHFCKSCRRYWTKGGVLRNVPVGGGCRKTKRKNTKPNNPSAETTATTTVKSRNSHSSSESSSLTATNTGNYESIKPTSFVQEGKWDSNREIFSEINGNFTGVVTSPSEQLQFGFDSSLLTGSQQSPDRLGGLIDQTVEIRETSDEGFGRLDWDQNLSLFELPNAVDHAYWIDQSQWVDQDDSCLYIP